MKDWIKGGVKVLVGYAIGLLIFVVFIYVFLSITGTSFNAWLPLYSILLFLLTFAIIYSDMKKLAIKEKKPQYELHPFPLKGLVYGLIGFFPIALLETVFALIRFGTEFAERVKHIGINTMMGPLYFIIRFAGESVPGYIAATLVIPVVAMFGYLAGYYGFELGKHFKKTPPPVQKEFKKSPWNPTTKATGAGKGKKVKKTGKTL